LRRLPKVRRGVVVEQLAVFQLPTTWFSPHEVSLKTVTINFGASLMDYLHGASG
jgi:hypothetical protein